MSREVADALREAKQVIIDNMWVNRNPDVPGEHCAATAITSVVGTQQVSTTAGLWDETCNTFKQAIGIGVYDSISTWNDDPWRTKQQVLNAFDRAIHLAERKELQELLTMAVANA